MPFTAAVRSVFSQYVGFKGRARRSEFWWFFLFAFLLNVLSRIIESALGIELLLSLVVQLAYLLPLLAVIVRRLHDTDSSGWWLLIGIVPFIGGIILLVFAAIKGTSGPNRFGPDPKGHHELDAPLPENTPGLAT
ncbi:DUF805 domain-containing protein [Salinispora arenicola]|uniref:DUF805 domain-containing protein n=1 Tax=Salinispora arenicola TaxID=168697 RepID=A0A542XUI1_SALAC|nr:DUF805 domain-containing protein [Salinispora arenicola]MCN0154043.1 DUF805 domain-containing protein [Salinispora arenicola]TQL39498.1 uncharacterized membrane protein YhaH (DUF805 family) [Salinispora arenicola]GIM86546.1 DUF805 domain-containing protein [Salinispora arenicola]